LFEDFLLKHLLLNSSAATQFEACLVCWSLNPEAVEGHPCMVVVSTEALQ
jgi:hypothetical protein